MVVVSNGNVWRLQIFNTQTDAKDTAQQPEHHQALSGAPLDSVSESSSCVVKHVCIGCFSLNFHPISMLLGEMGSLNFLCDSCSVQEYIHCAGGEWSGLTEMEKIVVLTLETCNQTTSPQNPVGTLEEGLAVGRLELRMQETP